MLEKIYNKVPPEGRDRAFVINHAILDLTQKKFVMRGLRDLSAYLIKHREEDEFATNLLGATLDEAAKDRRLKQGDLWQSAFKEWDRRNYVLDHSRKGWRRWGTAWIDEQEYQRIQTEKAELQATADAQRDVVDRAVLRLNSLIQQQQNAAQATENYNALRQMLYQVQTDPLANPWQKQSAAQQDANFQAEQFYSLRDAQRLYGEYGQAVIELQQEQAKLRALENKVIKPQWPREFDAVDPDAPWPPPTTQPGAPPVAPTTAPLMVPGQFPPLRPAQSK
jgi:hypothetical protein